MAGESLREKVFQKIREDILKGRYKKGDEWWSVPSEKNWESAGLR